MFDRLTERFQKVFRDLRGTSRLSEKNIQDALREVRMALLEADVHYPTVKSFVDRVKTKCLGQEVLASVSPGQQFVKAVHDELVALLGSTTADFALLPPPASIMMIGLHGSGKTTTTGKLARQWIKDGKKVVVAACDIRRPAAVDQLAALAAACGAACVRPEPGDAVPDVARRAARVARETLADVVLYDTGGRFQMDDDLLAELAALRDAVHPRDTVLVLDAAIGQESVSVAKAFHDRLGLTGLILTKLDGDARGGAALSVVSVVGCPILRVGVGEQPDDLEPFHPDRMASRILGMGDVVSLVEKVQATVDADEAARLQDQVIGRGRLTLEDLLAQMRQLKRFGSLSKVMDLIPGASTIPRDLRDRAQTEGMARMKVSEAVILSMTPRERRHPEILDARRRRRIAAGSGTTVADVNDLIRQFNQMRKMAKKMKGMSRFFPRPH
jgi:signal recognition particle subunit SRP54